jgi:hypothetical protein
MGKRPNERSNDALVTIVWSVNAQDHRLYVSYTGRCELNGIGFTRHRTPFLGVAQWIFLKTTRWRYIALRGD